MYILYVYIKYNYIVLLDHCTELIESIMSSVTHVMSHEDWLNR